MPAFYDPQAVQGADFTGYSKGFKSNSVVGGVFEGASQALDMGIKATDQYYQGSIKEQAREETQRLYDDYGNSAAVATEAGLDASMSPKEIQEGVNRLGLLKQATDNGTLKDSSFWAQAELISRQLKMRYPGYWEQIDGTMSQLLGRKPAQALQAEISNERQAAASKSDVERRQALAAARSVGLTEVFVKEAKGTPMSTIEINALVADRNNIKWQQEATSRTFSLKKARGEATEADAEKAFRIESHSMLTTALQDTASALFNNVKEYEAWANQVNKQRASGQGISPETQAGITAAKTAVKETVNNMKQSLVLKYGADMNPKTLEDSFGFMEQWVEDLTFQVEKGDLGVGKTNAAILEASKNYGVLQFMNSNEIFKKDIALKNAYGGEAYTAWMANNQGSGIFESRDIAIQDFMKSDLQLGTKNLNETIRVMNEQGITNPGVYNKHMTQTKNAMRAKETPPSVKENVVMGTYGPGNKTFLYDSVRPDERHHAFMDLTSPALTKELHKQYEEGNISPQAYQHVVDWTTRNAVNLIRDEAAEIESISNFRQSAQVSYDANTQQIKVTDIPFEGTTSTAIGRGLEQFYDKAKRDSAKSSVRKVNEILRNTKTIIENIGQDANEEIPLVLRKAGLIIEEPKTKEDSGLTPAIKATETTLSDLYAGFEMLAGKVPEGDLTDEERERLKMSEEAARYIFGGF